MDLSVLWTEFLFCARQVSNCACSVPWLADWEPNHSRQHILNSQLLRGMWAPGPTVDLRSQSLLSATSNTCTVNENSVTYILPFESLKFLVKTLSTVILTILKQKSLPCNLAALSVIHNYQKHGFCVCLFFCITFKNAPDVLKIPRNFL